ILDGRLPIDRTYDGNHLRTLHTALFGDIFDWAGVTRTYPMSKDGFAFAEPRQIPAYLDAATRHIASIDWDSLDRGGLAVETATTHAYLNTAHPWREGNGRSAKLFVRQLLGDHGHDLDLSRVIPAVWNQSLALTRPDLGTFEPVPDTLIPVFSRIIVDHTMSGDDTTTSAQAVAGVLTRGPSPRQQPPPRRATNPPSPPTHYRYGHLGPGRPAGPTHVDQVDTGPR
ncbi:MAG: Fic family protein, partial [Gordonia sp. (in: high G+C Gram-positive bacteria)]